MSAILAAALLPVNFPYTMLLGVVVLYWCSVVFGMADIDPMESGAGGSPAGGDGTMIEGGHIDGHIDAHVDAHIDGHLDAHVGDAGAALDGAHHAGDLVAPGHGDIHGPGEIHAGADGHIDGAHADGGELVPAGEAGAVAASGFGVKAGLAWMFDLGEVPITIPVSFFSLASWIMSVTINSHLGNANSLLLAAGLAVPIFIASGLITKVVTWPIRLVFRHLGRDKHTYFNLVGKTGKVVTSSLTEHFGQVEVPTQGAPLLLEGRAKPGVSFNKGDCVMIIAHDRRKDTYLVQESAVEVS